MHAVHMFCHHVRIGSVPVKGGLAPKRWERLHPMAAENVCMHTNLGLEGGVPRCLGAVPADLELVETSHSGTCDRPSSDLDCGFSSLTLST